LKSIEIATEFDRQIFQKNIALRAFASYRTRVSYMRGKIFADMSAEMHAATAIRRDQSQGG
jgi:hypothetical protein